MRKLFTAIIMLLASFAFADAGKCQIFINGKRLSAAGYSIAIPKEATVTEHHAAAELAKYLEQMTGEKLAVATQDAVKTPARIYVGKCDLPVKVNWKKLGLEGIHLQRVGDDLILAGGQRGVLYAVYSFLEDSLGCRWFTKDCVVIPESGVYRINGFRKVFGVFNGKKKVFVPKLEFRDTDYPSRKPAEFATPNKYNGPYGSEDPNWGGKIKYFGFVHTFEYIVPPSVYGKEHPEYFSEIEGERIPEGTQLCLTNPEVKKIAAEYIRKAMREHPDCTIFSVSQNDRHKYCECAKCTALANREGSQAGPLLHFVNYIADAVRDEFPDKAVDTLAYQYTRKPPKYVKPRPNVIVRLCSIECCFSHPLATCPNNKTFVDDIIGWSKLTKRLHIWDYVINYGHCLEPFPNLRVLNPNIKFFIKHGVTGIYEEANYFSKGGELAELRSYIMAKCLWDTNTDVEKVIKEFTDAYYGAAAPMIREYIEDLHDTVCDKDKSHVRIWSAPSDFLNHPDKLVKWNDLFLKAEAAVADNPTLLHRVKVAHIGVQYTMVSLSGALLKFENGRLVPQLSVDQNTITSLADTIKAEGITHVREGANGSAESWARSAVARTTAMDVKTLRNDLIAIDIIPSFGGRIWRAKYLPTGRDIILHTGNDKEGFVIDDNGYEEYANLNYRGPGFADNYAIVESGANFVVLKATMPNGNTITRRIEVLDGKAAFKVTSKMTSDKPVEKNAFRIHPAFMAEAPASSVFCRKADGSWKEYSLHDKKLPMGEHEIWMNKDRRPAGQWAILDRTDNIVLLDTFEDASIDFCYLNWKGSAKRVNLEEWSTPVNSDANNGPSIINTYEVMPLDKAPWNK